MKARENPYRSDQVLKIRYRFRGITLNEVLSRLQKLKFRAAIVGAEGSGKTTLLEDLQKSLLAGGLKTHWLRLTREYPRFTNSQRQLIARGFSADDIILFDGAETLGWIRFQLFRWQTRRAGGLIITTHQPGYLPTLLRSKASPELLEEIVKKLDPGFIPADIPGLFRQHRGNLREALRDRYDACANSSR